MKFKLPTLQHLPILTSKWWTIAMLGCCLTYPLTFEIGLTSATAAPLKVKLPPPPPRGIAGNRAAAASRDKCPEVAHPLTAIVPKYPSDQVWGLTGMDRPTFWFYVPYTQGALIDLSFTLQDESNPADPKIIYQNTQLAAPAKPGLMPIVLPQSTPPLKPNQSYHWFLTLNMGCTSGQRPMFVDGWVQRQNLDRADQGRLERATPRAQVALYADRGLLYDALTTLANLRSSQPQALELNQDWQNLLNAIDLGQLTERPERENRRSNPRPPSNGQGF